MLTESNWSVLIERIKRGLCTPFIGAGAAASTLPLGGDVAESWADEHDYPLEDRRDLARVAQYLGILNDPMRPKELLQELITARPPPDYSDPYEPHGLLADLPLPLYVTTNYDSFMVEALRARNRDPQQELCKWNSHASVRRAASPVLSNRSAELTPQRPVVFHLHGTLDVLESMVLTEDDYLEFLVAMSKRPKTVLPHQIERALSGTSLLFIGYALADWDFRVLHHGLVTTRTRSLRRVNVTVQLDHQPNARPYVEQYFGELDLSVFWGDATTFCRALRDRWESRGRV